MEIAKQLRFHLNSASSAENRQLLLQRILSSYEKSLLILKSSAPTTGMPESSISGDGSPQSEDCNGGGGFKDHHQDQNVVSKKRKVLPTWTDQVRISSENGFEGPVDDGYSWRKYGQKDILGTKYPRSYYRCTNRNSQNCWATKQVQRSDDDPTVFEIIYKGRHECNQTPHTAPPAPPSKAASTKADPLFTTFVSLFSFLFLFLFSFSTFQQKLTLLSTPAHPSFCPLHSRPPS
ncbi:unnamed protein product [Camellia sinensis]